MKAAVTLVITSCGRFDLLKRTMDSFAKYNTYPISATIVQEDAYREGQIKTIDKAYAQVRTPYIFHCEDDWEFLAPGFIEKSLTTLEAYPDIITVWLQNGMNHPTEKRGDLTLLQRGFRDIYNGFSFTPGLRRLADYHKLGRYQDHVLCRRGVANNEGEGGLSKLYDSMGYRAAILDHTYVRHIGEDRHIEDVAFRRK